MKKSNSKDNLPKKSAKPTRIYNKVTPPVSEGKTRKNLKTSDTSPIKKVTKEERLNQVKRQKILLSAILGCIILFLLLIIGIWSKKPTDSKAAKTISRETIKTDETDPTDATNISPTPTPFTPTTLTVSVVGDCTLGTDAYFDYSTSLNAYFDSYGAEYFFDNVRDIFGSDDLTIANFEGVLTDLDTRADKQFAFKAPASFSTILSSSSVEAVTLANNHSHDYGEQSFIDTKNALEADHIIPFGYEDTAVVDVKGIKVGLVGIYELNDHLDCAALMKNNIAKVKSEGAQLIIVIFHWGNEKETMPDTNQTTLGRMAIDEGADLVCGHHPHVLQGMETYKGKHILYSLGNFCFGGNSYPSDMDTIIYQETFTIDSDGVKPTEDINIIPCSISSDYGYNNYQPTPASGDEATRILQKFEERSSWIETP